MIALDFPRRVLMTADTIGGVWQYALALTRGLEKQGVEVVLATMGAAVTTQQWREARSLSNLVLCESSFKLEWMENPWTDLERAGDWLLGLEHTYLPGVVHLNSYAHGSLAWRTRPLVVAHSCVLSWWQAVRGEPPPPSWRRYAVTVTEGLRAAGLIVAPTKAMRDTLAQNYGSLPETWVIPNAQDRTRFRPLQKRPFILAAGRLWDEAKNIRSLALAASSWPWPVRVAGPRRGPEGDSIELDRLELLGHCSTDDLARLYGEAAIYALPAKYEPFGLSVLEAALAACSLVLGDIPSLRENWQSAAVFVPPDDSEALKRAVAWLIRNPDIRVQLGIRARERALGFTPEQMTKEYLRAYSRARECRRPPGLNIEASAA